MKKLAYVLMAMPMLLASCSGDEGIAENETVEVSFSAALPQPVQTRAEGTTLNVNKVVCAVFEDDTEISALRETKSITNGRIEYSPRLVKGRTYKVAFWAMNGDAYNVTDMKNISPEGSNYTGDPVTYECFTGCETFTVDGSPKSISLTRPMARVNLGVSTADMQAVEALGYTPTKVEVSFNVAKSYDALTGTCAPVTPQTMTLPIPENGSLSVGGTNYTAIASYMVFTDGSNVALTYKVYGTKGTCTGSTEDVIITQTIDNVPVSDNKNTNIVGDLMTGTVNYTVTMNNAYDTDNNI